MEINHTSSIPGSHSIQSDSRTSPGRQVTKKAVCWFQFQPTTHQFWASSQFDPSSIIVMTLPILSPPLADRFSHCQTLGSNSYEQMEPNHCGIISISCLFFLPNYPYSFSWQGPFLQVTASSAATEEDSTLSASKAVQRQPQTHSVPLKPQQLSISFHM